MNILISLLLLLNCKKDVASRKQNPAMSDHEDGDNGVRQGCAMLMEKTKQPLRQRAKLIRPLNRSFKWVTRKLTPTVKSLHNAADELIWAYKI